MIEPISTPKYESSRNDGNCVRESDGIELVSGLADAAGDVDCELSAAPAIDCAKVVAPNHHSRTRVASPVALLVMDCLAEL